MLLSISVFSMSVVARAPFLLVGCYSFFRLPLFSCVPEEPFLLFSTSLAKFSSSCALASLIPSLHSRAISL